MCKFLRWYGVFPLLHLMSLIYTRYSTHISFPYTRTTILELCLGLQSRSGDKPLKRQVVSLHNGTAVLLRALARKTEINSPSRSQHEETSSAVRGKLDSESSDASDLTSHLAASHTYAYLAKKQQGIYNIVL